MRTILQIEDDPNDVFFLQHALNKAGVANPIQVVTDGQMAIDYLKGAGKFGNREEFPMPGLILLDLKLPHVMGLDVLRWIREKSELTLVVLLLTASGEAADIATAYRLGANGFLIKPSEARKLEAMVASIRDFWLTQNILPPEPHFYAESGAGTSNEAGHEAFTDPTRQKRPAARANPQRQESGPQR